MQDLLPGYSLQAILQHPMALHHKMLRSLQDGAEVQTGH